MPQAVTIKSLPQAFGVIKAMQLEGHEWGEDYRQAGREALAGIIEGQMGAARRSAPGGDGPAGRGRPQERHVQPLALDRAGPYRAPCAAHPALQPGERRPGLCAARPAHRSYDPGLLRARPVHAQGEQGAGAGLGQAGECGHREPGGASWPGSGRAGRG